MTLTAIKAKADAAAQIAEAQQRAKDDMKDLRERLQTLGVSQSARYSPILMSHAGGQVKPMYETIKFLAKNYKNLRKEARDLQGEIEPMVKQVCCLRVFGERPDNPVSVSVAYCGLWQRLTNNTRKCFASIARRSG